MTADNKAAPVLPTPKIEKKETNKQNPKTEQPKDEAAPNQMKNTQKKIKLPQLKDLNHRVKSSKQYKDVIKT